jgi:dimethylaniline monooxygenase (N-oxide forming)
MIVGLERSKAMRSGPTSIPMHVAALTFARNAGAEPDITAWPKLERALLFGPLSPASFRLQGPDNLADAPSSILAAASAFGAIRNAEFTAEEQALRSLISKPSVSTAP